MSLRNKKNSGFTLIETFVAITVLVIAVLGPMTLLSRALQNSRYIKDDIIASYLAQEGVELMIDKRNKNAPFNQGDYSCKLYLDAILGYNCVQGTPSIFTRLVAVEETTPDSKQYKITSTVTRTSPPAPSKSIVSSSIIFRQ
jgi:type II secretory pathway pseudopilin PulG